MVVGLPTTFALGALASAAAADGAAIGDLEAIVGYGTKSSTVCQDSEQNWVDSIGRTCGVYSSLQYCTSSGSVGPGWLEVWGSPDSFAKGAGHALEVCCRCGGGKSSDEICFDDPHEWFDNWGLNCDIYAWNNYCTKSGDFGSGWRDSWGGFEKYSTNGISALQACCACGGGSKLGSSGESKAEPEAASRLFDAKSYPLVSRFGAPPAVAAAVSLFIAVGGVLAAGLFVAAGCLRCRSRHSRSPHDVGFELIEEGADGL